MFYLSESRIILNFPLIAAVAIILQKLLVIASDCCLSLRLCFVSRFSKNLIGSSVAYRLICYAICLEKTSFIAITATIALAFIVVITKQAFTRGVACCFLSRVMIRKVENRYFDD